MASATSNAKHTPSGHDVTPTRRAAIVTLVAKSTSNARQGLSADGTNGWLRGAHTLGCSLHPVATMLFDLVALCYSVNRREEAWLQTAGWRCHHEPVVYNPYSKTGAPLETFWAWDYAAKIIPFGLVAYERVVLIDSDAFAVEPQWLHSLYSWPLPDGSDYILATRDCVASLQHQPDATNEIQGGLIVLRPNASMKQRLLDARASTPSRDKSGQGFLSSFFRGRVALLPARFDYIVHRDCIRRYDVQTGLYRLDDAVVGHQQVQDGASKVDSAESLARAHIQAGSVAIVHFHHRPKPWVCNQSLSLARGCGWGNGGGAPTHVQHLHGLWRDADSKCKLSTGSS